MRKLVVIAVVLAGLWAGYWFIGAKGVEGAFNTWIEDRRADGWVSQAQDVSTRGFPNRFDTIFTGLELADPDTGLAWRADEFQILALSYQPNHVIAVWPGQQVLSSPEQNITFEATTFKGSLVFDPSPDLPLDRSSIVIEGLTMQSNAGWTAGLEAGQIATRKSSVAPHRHDIHFEATGLLPASSFIQGFAGGDLLPPVFERALLDASVDFTGPWDRHAIENARPQITRITLDEFDATWGELGLKAVGTVDVDERGLPTGEVAIKAKNWRKMIEIAEASGAIAPELVSTVTGALQFVAGLSGNSKTLDVTLRLSGGAVFLGPIPIGAAPIIKIR
ncbi:hypothetical protein ALP8811_00270 [Aliiroseovarius pelagivivens]|uniref:DUF2125 domain-containing protein n=1 Tax=Aliiroseovarius pelagivivens TaxID=1639690 RepID=A0A2R8AGT3_9RHOB|nr:DUF2125 domain-containing protein [Aliiroseovarius pelagivivens]SPF75283.1 hypothetical protein ALP8811_00270 [Aliiroseovarius pelagivivens]